jgi:hypothetical protein
MTNQKINYIPDVMSEWDCTVLDYMRFINMLNKIHDDNKFQDVLQDVNIEKFTF